MNNPQFILQWAYSERADYPSGHSKYIALVLTSQPKHDEARDLRMCCLDVCKTAVKGDKDSLFPLTDLFDRRIDLTSKLLLVNA